VVVIVHLSLQDISYDSRKICLGRRRFKIALKIYLKTEVVPPPPPRGGGGGPAKLVEGPAKPEAILRCINPPRNLRMGPGLRRDDTE